MNGARMNLVAPTDPRFKETFFLVEATSFEAQYLWERWRHRLTWEEQHSGALVEIGTLDDRPVTISVSWSRINGKLVGFWESRSQVTDHDLIKRWFAQNCVPPMWDNGTREGRCDATNFHLCAQAIAAANAGEGANAG